MGVYGLQILSVKPDLQPFATHSYNRARPWPRTFYS
jgi:hypothetical protein